MLGPGVPRARRPTGFLGARPERTFPFRSIGADVAAATFPEVRAMPQIITLPFTVINGNDRWLVRRPLRIAVSSRTCRSPDPRATP